MRKIAIPITEAMQLFPKFQPQWKAQHPDCTDTKSVALGNPRFCTVRHVVVVQTDENGKPIKALYDKMRVEEGPAGQDFPGTIIVPWFFKDSAVYVVMIDKEREVRDTKLPEFPQGYAEAEEDSIATGLRELAEETGCQAISYNVLGSICPEPDWYSRGTAILAVNISPIDNLNEGIHCLPLDKFYQWQGKIDSATTLATLLRFQAWFLTESLKNQESA